MEQKMTREVIAIMIVACAVMYLVDAYGTFGYLGKSIGKVILFLLIPLGYGLFRKELQVKRYFKLSTLRMLLPSLALGGGVYLGILAGYFLLGFWIDLAHIASLLENNLNVHGGNFLAVALYIAFVNSLLEEFFFRGFIFLTLLRTLPRSVAYGVSALAFAAYHVAILTGWFSWPLYLLAIVGLFMAGVLFNWLDEKTETLYHSWLVHMCANFGINTIGFLMFAQII